MLRFTVPLKKKKHTDYCILCWWHTNLGSGVCSVKQLLSAWNELASGRAPRLAVLGQKTEMCALSLKLVIINHHRLQVQHIQKWIPLLPLRQTNITFITSVFFFMWFDLCDPFLGVQYCWNDILEDLLSSSNRYVRWSLKRAKCTVCISSNLLRGNLAFTRHTQVVGKDI